MSFRTVLAAAAATLALAPALAHEGHKPATADGSPVVVTDAYARVSETGSGAVFFVMHNASGHDDILVATRSDVAEKVELHTHKMDGNGVMQMSRIEGGIPLAVDADHALKRGGDHVMLMGLKTPMQDGDSFALTLVFETAGEITFDVTVDNQRKPGDAMAGKDGEGCDEAAGHAHGASPDN
ncbi:MAG: copper chaperone PCu(A)C [Rhodobacteraceae bacterium]|nr:copper chaperone PCu(A)C [Paracoccaceae bacterium]